MLRSFRDAFDISRSLSRGAEALRAAPWPLLVGALLMQCTESSGGNYSSGNTGTGGGDPWDDMDSWDSYDWQGLGTEVSELTGADPAALALGMGAGEAAIIVVILVVVLGMALLCGGMVLAFRAWVHAGYLRLHHEILLTGEGRFGTLFGATDAFLRMVGFKVVAALIHSGILLLALLPGLAILIAGAVIESTPAMVIGGAVCGLLAIPCSLYVWLGLYFGNHAVALDHSSVMGAVERSWDLARGNRLWMLLYLFVTGVVWWLGMCLCIVGIVVTRALVDTARTEAYLMATREPAESDALWTLGT